MRKDSKASQISNIVNSTLFNPLQVGIELSTDHRHLQNEMFEMFLHFCGQLKRNKEKGVFDARNEFACKCAKTMIDALEKEGLYLLDYWNDRYDEQLKKSFD